MKILHIHPAMQQGGIEAMITGLANEIADRNEDVSVCSIFTPTDKAVFWKKLNQKVKKFDLGKSVTGFSIKEIFKVFLAIKRGKYDVVNLHGFFYYYALSVLLLHRKIKFFYTVHSDAFMENSTWDKRFIKLKRFCFQKGWVTPITISPSSQESFTNLYHCESHLIPNGVARPVISATDNIVDEIRLTPSTKVFLHPGRITKAKNQVALVKSFDRLIKDGENVLLLIVGSNDDNAIYQELLPYFSDRIRYVGTRSDVPELLAKADAFCLPSIWEGLPVTLLEALSVGCIPICSPVGGVVNVIQSGENGLLSASSSERDYYSALKVFLQMSKEELAAMKQRCLDSFAPYDIAVAAQSYLRLYKSKTK